jgi:hypothetical protein
VTRHHRFAIAARILLVLLAVGSLFLWTLSRPWYEAGLSSVLGAVLTGVATLVAAVDVGVKLRGWLSGQTPQKADAWVRNAAAVAVVLGVATLVLQPYLGAGSSGPAGPGRPSGAAEAGRTPMSQGSASSPAAPPVRSTTPGTGATPSAAARVPSPQPAGSTAPAAAPSGTRYSKTVEVIGSRYLNLDVVPFDVAKDRGTEQKFDLQLEEGQVTPMTKTRFGLRDAKGCGPMSETATAYPFPGQFCGTTFAGQFFVITLTRGDGKFVTVVVELFAQGQ